MSMASGCGASAAAEEIMAFIDAQREMLDSDGEAFKQLTLVYNLAKEIKQAGDSGWY